MKKIKYNVARATTPDLIQQGKTVLKCLTDNPDFQNPYPSLSDWETAFTRLSQKYSEAQFGSKVDREKFKAERKSFSNMMRQMINYINTVAISNGTRCDEIILESGFDYNRTAQPVPVAGEIKTIEAFMTGKPGEVLVKVSPSKNARFYEFYVSTDSVNFTLIKTQQERNAYITGLESVKRYYFKVKGLNKSGASGFSAMVSMIAA